MWKAQDFLYILCFLYRYAQISDKFGGVCLLVLCSGELVMVY
jgi:hypothetical protein